MVLNIDSSIFLTDWLKPNSWDLPTDVQGFLNAIGGIEKLDHFMELPAAEAMPASLRGELLNVEVSEYVAKHLAGKHDQSSHAGGKGSKTSPAPLNFQREKGFTSETTPAEWSQSLSKYTDGSGTYGDINGWLREGEMYADQFRWWNKDKQIEIENHITNLDNLIDAAPRLDAETTTYRGISGEAAYEFQILEVGDSFTEAGFVSTSWDKNVASRFASSDDGVMLKIISPKGTSGIATEGFMFDTSKQNATEKEWLLPRGTTFDVIAVDDNSLTVQVNNEVLRVRQVYNRFFGWYYDSPQKCVQAPHWSA